MNAPNRSRRSFGVETDTATWATDSERHLESLPSTNAKANENPKVLIHYGGKEFVATSAMAANFLARAQRILNAEKAESVALLHDGGLELLFIAENIPFDVGNYFHTSITTKRKRA